MERVTIGIGASAVTSDATSLLGFGHNGNFKGLQLEIGNKLDFATFWIQFRQEMAVVHREGVGGLVGKIYGLCTLKILSGPVDKIVSRVRCGDDGHLVAVVDGSITL